MEYKKPLQIILSKKDTFTRWKEFTKEMKKKGIQTNKISTFMVEEFLEKIELDREKIMTKLLDQIKS